MTSYEEIKRHDIKNIDKSESKTRPAWQDLTFIKIIKKERINVLKI